MLAYQREILVRRPVMLGLMEELTAETGLTFTRLGPDKALEHATLEAGFTFWQHAGSAYCDIIPAETASDQEIFQVLVDRVGLPYFSDSLLLADQAYYYQDATQLGYPAIDEAPFADLLLHPGTRAAPAYAPQGVPVSYDPGAMEDIAGWLAAEGERLMFIYGEEDPWTAAAFDPTGAVDSHVFVVPQGNHQSRLIDLPEAEGAQALDALEAWTGVRPRISRKVTKDPVSYRAPRPTLRTSE